MINEERLVERFLEYIQIDSPTKEELEFAKHIKAELEKLGLEVIWMMQVKMLEVMLEI